MIFTLALLKPLLVGIPASGVAIVGGLFVFYPSALGIDVKNHKKNTAYSAIVIEDTSVTALTGTIPDGEKAIQCSIGDEDSKVDCSIKKVELSDEKKWMSLANVKADTFNQTLGDNFFTSKPVYAIKLKTEDFNKVTYDATSKIKIHEKDKEKESIIKGNIKPIFGISTSEPTLKGKTKFFLAQAKTFTDVASSQPNPQSLAVENKQFKCSFTDNDSSAQTCKIYNFSADDASTSESDSYTNLTMQPPSTASANIEQHKHYLIKIGGPDTDLSTITADKTDIYTNVYESDGTTTPSTGVSKVTFTKLAPIYFHPSNKTSFAFVLK